MPRAVNGRKECTKCHEVKDATKENFGPNRACFDNFRPSCRPCERQCINARNHLPVVRAQQKAYRTSLKGQTTIKAHKQTQKYRNAAKAYLAKRRQDPEYRARQTARQAAYMPEYNRCRWQRAGKGIHKARIQDWREYFDGLASDSERCIAAHVLTFLGDVDTTASKVVRDDSFDYNYLAQHFDIDNVAPLVKRAS